jgi:hypothetical protein
MSKVELRMQNNSPAYVEVGNVSMRDDCRPRREEFNLSGLVDLIFIGNVRNRTDQPGTIDLSSTLGKSGRRYDEYEVILHLPSEPESYIRLIDVKIILESELVIAEESLKLYAEQTGRADILKRLDGQRSNNRHVITEDERKAKSKSAIQLAVEAYLDSAHDGNKAAFYTFLKKQIKLPREVILKDGQSYAYFFKEVKEVGSQEGVYITSSKEGKKEGEPAWNHYSGNAISTIISKEKSYRKKQSQKNSS